MKLGFLCKAAGITCPAEEEEREILSVCVDSRRAEKDCLYICIRGFRTDGHSYISDVINAGAAAIVIEEGADVEVRRGVCFLSCKDPRQASAMLFDAWYGFPSQKLQFIGVTGTNGKTSVTYMLRHILESSLYRCGLIGTVGCESAGKVLKPRSQEALANMTTPDPEDLYRMLAQMVEDRVEYVLMEATSHALALGKLAPIEFRVAIFTNLTPEHLDFHGNMEQYAAAKAALFERCECAVINADSPYAEEMIKHTKGTCLTCGCQMPADYTCEDVEYGTQGVGYRLISKNFNLQIRCNVPGNFTVINSVEAAVCALELGIGAGKVKDALASLSGVRGRLEKVRLDFDADFDVFIDYAHTPDALQNLLRTARGFCKKEARIVLVFGCGGDRDRSKRPVMGSIATTLADRVIVTSDNSRSESPEEIITEILSGTQKQNYTAIPDHKEAILHAIMTAKKDDVILLAGKGHEEYEIGRDGRIPFREKEVVRNAFALRREKEKNTGKTETGS